MAVYVNLLKECVFFRTLYRVLQPSILLRFLSRVQGAVGVVIMSNFLLVDSSRIIYDLVKDVRFSLLPSSDGRRARNSYKRKRSKQCRREIKAREDHQTLSLIRSGNSGAQVI